MKANCTSLNDKHGPSPTGFLCGHSPVIIAHATNWPTTINTYDADGRLIKVAFPNGTETGYDYGTYWDEIPGQLSISTGLRESLIRAR